MRQIRENKGIIVAHPGTQHSFETAAGLAESGLLLKYVTSFRYQPDGVFARLLRLVPFGLGAGIDGYFRRRSLGNFRDKLVSICCMTDLLFSGPGRAVLPPGVRSFVMRMHNRRFGCRVAAMLRNWRPDAVIGPDTASLQIIKAAKEVRCVAVLDQTVAHMKTGATLLKEEAELCPDFADSLGMEAPAWLVDQCIEEARLADFILAGSDFVKETVVDAGADPSRVHVLPYGADMERFRPGPPRPEGSFRVLFVGSISQRKGIKYLLEAFKRIRVPNAELLLVGNIVGSGKGLRSYRGIFTYVSRLPGHEIHRVFQNADLFVFPSLLEGSARVVYEAMASGLPVITTLSAGSVVRDGKEGFVVPIRNVEALMEKMELLYKNLELRKEMGIKARARAEQFTWKDYGRQLSVLLKGFIEERSGKCT